MGWIATALIFMLAIGGTVRTNQSPLEGDPSMSQFVDHVVTSAREQASTIGKTIDKAWVCALVASLLTVIALGLGLWLQNPVQHDWQEARVALSAKGQATFAAVCANGLANKAVEGTLDIDSLDRTYALIKIPARSCYHGTKPRQNIQITLPPAQILGYAQKLQQMKVHPSVRSAQQNPGSVFERVIKTLQRWFQE